MTLAQMVELGYNAGVNHIKSSRALERTCYPFSTCDRSARTMPDHTPTQHPTQEIPYGYCHCGCGQPTTLATHTVRARGLKKGEPVHFIKGHQNHKPLLTPDGLKECSKCKKAKPLSEFSQYKTGRDAGKTYSVCCACKAAYSRAYHRAHRENILKKQSEYGKQRHRQKRSTADKIRGRAAVNLAVSRGALPPAWTMVCEHCQEAQAAHWHHHRGYARENWLDVVSLCLDCHGKEHRVHES